MTKKFPNQTIYLYLAAPFLVGTFISVFELGNLLWIRKLFVSVDAVFPTFRTWFVNSQDPTGCKVMLLLWWTVYLPLGIYWTRQVTNGFKPENPKSLLTAWTKTKLLVTSLVFIALLSYGPSFMDQSENMASAAAKYGRTSLVPFLINKGPAYFAIFLAPMSLLFVLCVAMSMFALLNPHQNTDP